MTAAVCLVLTALGARTAGDSVYGVVRDAVTGDGLAGVVVDAPELGRTQTDDAGVYVMRTRGPGFRHLRFSRSGFQPLGLDISVPERRSLQVDVVLDPVPVALPPINVAASPELRAAAPPRPDIEIGLRRYEPAALRSNPLVAPDDPLTAAAIEQAVTAQPGTLRPLRVHGGSSDQNLVLLDGLPVYSLSHLGGIEGVIDPDLLEHVDLYSAVPPAQFGGRLSSLLSLQLQPGGQNTEWRGALSPIAVRQSLSTPVGRGAGIQLSLRRSYRGLFPGDVNDAEENGFSEVLLRTSMVGKRDELTGYALGGSDNLTFASVPGLRDDQARVGNGFDWSHRTLGLVWSHQLDSRYVLDTRVWDSRADGGIGWGVDSSRQHVGSRVGDMGVSMQVTPAEADGVAMLGLSLSRLDARYSLVEASAGVLDLHSAPALLVLFGEHRWSLDRHWSLTTGLRVNAVSSVSVLPEPRLSSRWQIADGLSVLAGYGRSYQFVQSLRNEESVLDFAVGAELPVAVGAPGVRPARSDQLSGALVAHLGASSIRLDAYTRWLRDLVIVPATTAGPFARALPPSGSGRAGGLVLDVVRPGRRLDLHVLAGTERSSREVAGERFTPGALRGHWLAAGVGIHVDSGTIVRLAGSVGSGATTTTMGDVAWGSPGMLSQGGEIEGTPEAVGSFVNPDRLPPYHRLDLGLLRDWPVTMLGRRGLLTTSITLTNLLSTPNPLGYAAASGSIPRVLRFPPRTLDLQLRWRF